MGRDAKPDPASVAEPLTSDYVDFCGAVLVTAKRLIEADANIAARGVTYPEIAAALFPDLQGTAEQRKTEIAVMFACTDLSAENLLDPQINKKSGKPNGVYQPTQTGRAAVVDPTDAWHAICAKTLEDAHVRVLEAVNSVSLHRLNEWAVAELAFAPQVAAELGAREDDEIKRMVSIARELGTRGLVAFQGGGTSMAVRSTYAGAVRATRRDFTVEARELRQLTAVGETTSVELKRQLSVNTKDEKAEFVKDILGLANTKASPPHVLIVGFDNDTLAYIGPPDPAISQDRLEQILSAYASPAPQIHYRQIATPSGPVGRIDVIRQAAQLPYRVRVSVGEKKRIAAGEVFVRHGSQTARASEEEIEALTREAERERERSDSAN